MKDFRIEERSVTFLFIVLPEKDFLPLRKDNGKASLHRGMDPDFFLGPKRHIHQAPNSLHKSRHQCPTALCLHDPTSALPRRLLNVESLKVVFFLSKGTQNIIVTIIITEQEQKCRDHQRQKIRLRELHDLKSCIQGQKGCPQTPPNRIAMTPRSCK